MKKLVVLSSIVLAASVAFAQNPPSKPEVSDKAKASASETPATREMTANVISTDVDGKTITVRSTEVGAVRQTLKVEGKALTALKTFKGGDKVKLVCKTDDKGEESSVTEIKLHSDIGVTPDVKP